MSQRVCRMALVQMKIGSNKAENIARAVNLVREAKQKGSELVVLPECFNSPYGTKYFGEYAEEAEKGETSLALSAVAKETEMTLVGGSLPERDGDRLYNTTTVWGPSGQLLAKLRKVHLFDIDIPGGIKFRESEVLSAGSQLATFQLREFKFGLGICYDLRFHEMAALYRNMGVDALLYPGAFNMKTGPLHWELLLRARAVDNQVYVAGVCGAQDTKADYVAWGHSMLVDPWGQVKVHADFEETLLICDLDKQAVLDVRGQIPTSYQRRTDLYDTISKSVNSAI